jgi:hypothetical protein
MLCTDGVSYIINVKDLFCKSPEAVNPFSMGLNFRAIATQ